MINDGPQIQYINTLNGKVRIEEYENFTFLPHEHIFQNLSHLAEGKLQISLLNLQEIKKKKFQSLENLVLNDPVEMAFELSQTEGNLVLLDATNQQNGQSIDKLKKLQKLLPQHHFLTGYSIPIIKRDNLNLNTLYSLENIQKKLELEISVGTNDQKPAFFGEIIISQLDQNDDINMNFIQTFFYLSDKIGIPILFDVEGMEDSYIKLQQILREIFTKYKKANVIIANPFLQIEENIHIQNQEVIAQTSIKNLLDLNKNLQLQNVYYIFDLNQFQYKNLLPLLQKLLESQCKDKVFLTPGVKYKTNLKSYGGDGFQHQQNNKKLLQLFAWVREQVQIKEVRLWKCPICQKDFDDSIEKFKKFEQEYCSIKCLREGIKK